MAIIINVNHPNTLDARLLVLSSSIFLSLAIFRITKRIGTAIISFMTVVYINALIESIFTKSIPNPIMVDTAITK
jgi:uncharacterized membrane protein (DUF2068 family)